MSDPTRRLVVVGSLNLDCVSEVREIPRPGETVLALRTSRSLGGKGANQAVSAARHGAAVAMIGCVGDDGDGAELVRSLAAEGVDTSSIHARAGHATGTAQVIVSADGANCIVVAVGANGELTPAGTRSALDGVGPHDVVLIQLDVPPAVVADVLREADRRQLRVVVNASPYATVDPEAAALADPFVVGERDAGLLADVGVMPRSLCVTFGRAGAVWDGLRMDSGDLGSPALAPGGTEAFCGTLAATHAAGCDRPEALRAAVAAAGNVEDD